MTHDEQSHAIGRLLTLQDFDFPYPERLVAQEPRATRDQARLLVRQADGGLAHVSITDLTTKLPRGTLLILNDSKVFPSRIFGRLPTGGQVELFLLAPLGSGNKSDSRPSDTARSHWRALGRPMKKLHTGTKVLLPGGLEAEVCGKIEDGAGNAFVDVAFAMPAEQFSNWLDVYGFIPLPPYIRRRVSAATEERHRYQTVYAREPGSVAAPTAGLHFTPELLTRLSRECGIEIRHVSLHVGAGTFLPVKTDDVSQHQMHAERYRVSRETAQALIQARSMGRPVVAVGTTTLRSLESLWRRAGGDQATLIELADAWATTELFIRPVTADDRYRPWVLDGLITNFHQPCSTLFMLVSALVGLANAKALYREAVARDYQLYSYGDACLLWL